MNREEAIAIITSQLASLDDESVEAVAGIVKSMAGEPADGGLPRALTARELELIEQSKEDFRAGRTYSHEEIVAMLDERLAPLGVPKSTA